MAKISVVIPLYNKAAYIKRAIDSVLAQTSRDFEIIIVNDASTDGSEKIAGLYADKRIRIYNRDVPSPGGHAARNLGIKSAKTGLIAFLDGDDEWSSGFIDTICRLSIKYPTAGAYATAYKEKKTGKKPKKPFFWFLPRDEKWEGLLPDYFKSAVYGASPVWSGAVAVRVEVFQDVGYFPEGVRRGGDLDMWARIALRYDIAFSNYVGAVYYKDVEDSVVKKNKVLHGYRVVETLKNGLKRTDVPLRRKKYIDEYMNKFILGSAAQCIKVGEMKLARQHLNACKTKKFFLRKAWLKFLSGRS